MIRPYYDIMDPFLVLNTAATVTTKLKIGTGIALLTQRDPIVTAKVVSTIDQLSHGRFLFGVGNGWNQDEIENHGTAFESRHKLARERMEAMKTIWTEEEPEYHGEFVNFDKMKQWPKPFQKPHPPIIVGGAFPYAARRAIRYGDGWIPRADRLEKDGVGVVIDKFRDMAKEAGRDPASLPITIFRVPEVLDQLKLLPGDRRRSRHLHPAGREGRQAACRSSTAGPSSSGNWAAERDAGASHLESPHRKTLHTGTSNVFRLKTVCQVPDGTGQRARRSCATFFAKPPPIGADAGRFGRPFTRPGSRLHRVVQAKLRRSQRSQKRTYPSCPPIELSIVRSKDHPPAAGRAPRAGRNRGVMVGLGILMCRHFAWKWSTGDMPQLCARISTGILRTHQRLAPSRRRSGTGRCPLFKGKADITRTSCNLRVWNPAHMSACP